MYEWIVELCWDRTQTPQLEDVLVLKRLLDTLEPYAPVFAGRMSNKYHLVVSVEAEWPRLAKEAAEGAARVAFMVCELPWPSQCRVSCEISTPSGYET